ncbi:MAG TPA: translation initiation factor IF-2 subunit gamma [archaeon]|nr:translation initiation factor IF-2 subunit gamma [archaeon]
MERKPLVPEVSIGLVGHVDHGKTSLTEALTGKWTDTHSEEIKRGITIRLGYAESTFYKCPKCKGHEQYSTTPKCQKCFSECKPVRTVSFVDAPGHETLMATVLSGAALMDGALLLVSAIEQCPQAQTREHLKALEIVGIKNIVVVQNKIDLATEEQALKNYQQIKAFLKGSIAENAPIIPVSARQNINIDALMHAIETTIPTPKRDAKKGLRMLVARSFDVNRPGTPIEKLKGAVIGGSIIEGQVQVGDQIELSPGIKMKDRYQPVSTKVTGIQQAMMDVQSAGPGGLVGISTELDPYWAKSDSLTGTVIGVPGKLPKPAYQLALSVNLLERVVGSKEELKVEPIKINDPLMLTMGTARTVGVVTLSKGSKISTNLKLPVCAEKGDKVAISRQVLGRWRLIGWGIIEG